MSLNLLDTTTGAGDTGKAGGDKINAMFRELYGVSKMLLGRPTVATMGHSYARDYLPQAIALACYRYSRANIYFDFRKVFGAVDGNGATAVVNPTGTTFAVGGSTSSHMATTQLTEFLKRPTQALYIWSGHNDDWSTTLATQQQASLDNVKTVIEAALATGVTRVIRVMGEARHANASAAQLAQYNAKLAQLCRTYTGVRFLPTGDLIADHKRTDGGTALQADKTNDGTHLSVRGEIAAAARIGDDQKDWCPVRTPRFALNAGAYDATATPYGNVFGPVGLMIGTQGVYQNAVPGTVAGTADTSRLLAADGLLNPAIDTGPYGQFRQLFTLPAGGGDFTTYIQNNGVSNVNGGDASRRYESEFLLDLIAVNGFKEAWIKPVTGQDDYTTIHTGSPSGNDNWPGPVTAELFYYSLFPHPAKSDTATTELIFSIAGAASGTIGLSGLLMAQVN